MHSISPHCFKYYFLAGPAGDYIARSGLEVTFLPEEETKTVRVRINDDSNLESLENFFGNLMISSDSVDIAEITVPQATVDINDNDSKYPHISPPYSSP